MFVDVDLDYRHNYFTTVHHGMLCISLCPNFLHDPNNSTMEFHHPSFPLTKPIIQHIMKYK